MNAEFDREDPRGLGHALASTLKALILEGVLRPGDQIPSESALTDQYGVSRTVVREATASLRAAGLVETFQGRGSVVLRLPDVSEPAPHWLSIQSPEDVLGVLDLRLGVEPQAAALAATRRTSAQLAAIRRAFEDFAALEGKRTGVVARDFALHEKVALASGNRYMRELLGSLGPRMILLHRTRLDEANSVMDEHHFARLIHEHGAIAHAIERQDPEGAAAAMTAHLRRSRAALVATGISPN